MILNLQPPPKILNLSLLLKGLRITGEKVRVRFRLNQSKKYTKPRMYNPKL